MRREVEEAVRETGVRTALRTHDGVGDRPYTKEYGSSWIFELCLTWANVLQRVQRSAFSLGNFAVYGHA
jgi:hypothetical protein